MSHARQQVRDAIVTLLNTSPTNYNRAYNTRIPPMQQVWPYLLVWNETESIPQMTIHPAGLQMRELSLTIEARLQLQQRETETLEARMDTVAAEIETKLTSATIQTALAAVDGITLVDTQMQLAVDENDVPSYGYITMNYTLSYATNEGTPGTLV